jgi:hypothetical protein
MMRKYYDLLLISGIRWSVWREMRQMDHSFYGCGFPHPGVECFIGKITKLLTNYGCNSGLGHHFQMLMELLVIEAGVSTQVLSRDYAWYSGWVSHCWQKYVWEKVSLFNLNVEIRDLPLRFPCANDEWLMLVLKETGYLREELVRLNRVRCHQQAIFYSDIFDSRGRSFDRCYRTRHPEGETWSSLIFPVERPPARDFQLWRLALEDIAPRGVPRRWLGSHVGAGHKLWPMGETLPEVTVEEPSAFWQVLTKWERMWMWDNLQWEGNNNWIAEAIWGRTCVAVTDSSYMGTLYPEIHSAAFVLECTKGSGRLWGSFLESSHCACSYRGELAGLMAIHLILLAVNEVNKDLTWHVHIYSDCLGALNMVKNLPPSRIPTRSPHSNVLKNILMNCGNLSFD